MSTSYYRSLDGLRAVAVGIVMVAHAGFSYPRSGGVGVDIFFVLSGFLILPVGDGLNIQRRAHFFRPRYAYGRAAIGSALSDVVRAGKEKGGFLELKRHFERKALRSAMHEHVSAVEVAVVRAHER